MPDKKTIVAVAGANGRAGKLIVKELIKRGHLVWAIIIRPFDPPQPPDLIDDNIEIKEGSFESVDKITNVLNGADYLISAIGSTKPFSGKEFEKVDVIGNHNLAVASKAAGIKRMVVISSIGAGDSKDAMTCIFRMMMGTVIKAKTKMEDMIKKAGIDYTIIRPGGYTTKPLAGEIAISEGGKISGLVMREDIAKVCVDAIEKDKMRNRTFEVVNMSKLKEDRKQYLIEI